MIAEAAIAGATICFVTCLRFTRFVIERTDSKSEKRRLLERQRDELDKARMTNGSLPLETRKHAANLLAEVDKQLLKLADEP
jgi:hypothetical protein